MEETTSLFSSLPNDNLLNVLARVPIRYYPILSRVSKKLQSIVRSSELHKTRSLMGKESRFYVCFRDLKSPNYIAYHWFTLTENRRLVSTPFPSPPERYSTALMVGPEIYIDGGYFNNYTSSMWILDSQSGKLRQGLSSLVATCHPAVGLVDDKIYIIGGCKKKEIQAQVFDTKTQTWGVPANPSPSLDRKIYARHSNKNVVTVYDLKDANCEIINLPADNYCFRKDVCVIDNVFYNYYLPLGLRWYDFKEKAWRVVAGLNFNDFNFWNYAIAEYNGKLAFLWHDRKKMEIRCEMIALRQSGVAEVQGRVEWSSCVLSDVPGTYYFEHCLGRTD